MRIESLPLSQTVLGKRIIQVVTGVAQAADALRSAWTQTPKPSTPSVQPQSLVSSFLAAGRRAVGMPSNKGEFQLGRWEEQPYLHQQNERLNLLIRSLGARYSKTTDGMGIEPYAWGVGQISEITPIRIANAQRRATQSGYVDQKIDLHTRFLREDSHVGGVDAIRRSVFYRAPFRIAPSRGDVRPVAIMLANAVRAALEHMDGFRSTCAEINGAMAGFGAGELVWRPGVRLAIPAGNITITAESEVITSIEPIGPRYAAFDVVTESPWLCYGPEDYVDMADETLQKFMIVKGDGQAALPTRFRGWGWANDWLSYLGALDLEKLGIVIETFGVPTPYLQRNDGGIVTDNEAAQALQLLADIGTGKPGVVSGRMGELKHSPVPSGLQPLHAQMLSVVRTEQSKRILSSTLQTQLDSNGSWAAADIHEGQETKITLIDTYLQAEAFRTQPVRWLVDVNADSWARAFSRYIPGGVTPDELRAVRLECEFVVTDESPETRMKVFAAAKELGVETDPEQIREEARIRQPLPTLQLVDREAIPEPQTPPEPAADTTPKSGNEAERKSGEDRPKIQLTPSALGIIIKVNEAREDLGRGPIDGGELTIAEYKAKHSQVVSEAAKAEDGQAQDGGINDGQV